MGIYDRDYAREREPGVHARMPESMVVRLMIVTGMIYLVQVVWPPFTDWFALDADWYRQPWKVYQLLTAGFLHDPDDMWHILFNMLGLWFFGQGIEERYGSREFLIFYLVTIVAGNLLYTLAELPYGSQGGALGASGAITAIVILYAFNFPHRQALFMFFIPMPMWVLGCILVASDMFGAVARSENIGFTAHLGGALFALAYYKLNWRLSTWLPRDLSLPNFKRKPKLRVHHPLDDDEDENGIDARVDAILDKISKQGRESLTRAEKKLLEQASREYQQRRK